MADIDSGSPIRSDLPGQANYNDVIVKIGDATNPATQIASVDTNGSLKSRIADATGAVITSQTNGAQRALDVGINVAGVQIDPRLSGQYNSALQTYTSGSFVPLATDVNGRLLTVGQVDQNPATGSITTQDTGTATVVSGNQTFYTGTPTAGSFVAFTLSSNETLMLETTGTWTGTLQSEISVDGGTTWVAHSIHLIGSPTFLSSFTTNAIGSLNVAAKTNFRVRATAAMTGSATIRVVESQNASSVYVANAIKLVDASSTTSTVQANIVAASTAAGSANTALVVALSPNSPLPAGTAVIGAVNQGTSPWVTKDQADGPVAPGTAAAFSILTGGIYNSTFPTLTSGQQSAIQLNANGQVSIRPLTAADIVTSNQGAPNTTANAWPTKITDGTNTAAVKAASTAAVATDPSLVVQLSPNNFPIPVVMSAAESGTPIEAYNTASAVAAGATSNHQYTVTAGKTLSLQQIEASASGKMKIEVQVETGVATNVFTTRFVQFNSTNTPNMSIKLAPVVLVAAGVRVQIIRTNKDLLAMDLYSTIGGQEQ